MVATKSKAPLQHFSNKPRYKKQRLSSPTQDSQTVAPPYRTPVTFFDLPREIRDEIYHYVLATPDLRRLGAGPDAQVPKNEHPLTSSANSFIILDDDVMDDLWAAKWRDCTHNSWNLKIPALAQTSARFREEVMTSYFQLHPAIHIIEDTKDIIDIPRTKSLIKQMPAAFLSNAQAIVIEFTFHDDDNDEDSSQHGAWDNCIHQYVNTWTNPMPLLLLEEELLLLGARKVVWLRDEFAASRVWKSACHVGRALRERGFSWDEVETVMEELEEMRHAACSDIGGAAPFFPCW